MRLARLTALALLLGCTPTAEPEPEPDPPAEPLPAERLDLGVGAEGLTLAGTLRLPERTGPVPAVIFVHGSGPNSRDQPAPGQLNMNFGLQVHTFRDLADGLQAAGIASYTYDKRTCGPFNGCATNGYPNPPAAITVQTFVDDAVAACTAIGARSDIGPVWIAGHSQGGQLTPEIVHACDASGGLLLAAPFDPIDAVIAAQLAATRALLADVGQDEQSIDRATAPLRQIVDELAALRGGEHDGSDIQGASAAFWQSWIDAGEAAPDRARSLDQPLYALGGSYDWNVPPTQLASWAATFQDSDAPRDTAELDCVAHPLNCLSEPDFRELTPETIGAEVDPRVTAQLAAWITR